MDAKLIGTHANGELRFARTKKDTWPGYHESFPLGKRGYWFGNERQHIFVGHSKEQAILNYDYLVSLFPSRSKKKIYYSNEFHNTETFVLAEPYQEGFFVTWEQENRAINKLCSIALCTCEACKPERIRTFKEGFVTEG